MVNPIIESKFPVVEVDYYLDGEFINSIKKSPFDMVINLNIPDDKSEFEIKIKLYDSIGNSVEKSVVFGIE